MKRFILPCLLLCSLAACTQSGSDTLLREVSTKLSNGSTSVSAILTDKKFLALHPQTPFRQLIEKKAGTGIVKIAIPEEPGKKIRVLGTITDAAGNPVNNALVYLYQTDARGWYAADAPHVLQNEGDMRHARLFGYIRTDAKGNFELHTVKPKGYPNSDLPAHIHVHVMVDGYKNYVNEFLFDDDDRLVGEIRSTALQNQFLVAQPEKAGPGFDQQFSYRIQLEKN